MRNGFFRRQNWHICLLAALVLAFSVCSMVICLQKTAGWASDQEEPGFSRADTALEFEHSEKVPGTTDTTSADYQDTAHDIGGALTAILKKTDDIIGHINRLWDRSLVMKPQLSRTDSVLTYCLTGEIASGQVICGTEGWLFYKSPNDGDSMADYEGSNRFTQEELDSMLKTTLAVQHTMEDKGICFALLVAPNKENIYSEFMPGRYHHESVSRTDRLMEFLAENGVNAISPKRELLDCRGDHQLYYACDSHWNQLGAYIGVKEVLDSWGIAIAPLNAREIRQYALSANYHEAANDDLARMAGLIRFFDWEQEFEIEGSIQPEWDLYTTEQNLGRLCHFENPEASHGTVLLVGDSYRSAMLPTLSEVFRDVYVIHRSSFTAEMLRQTQPDYVIAEYVERYSEEIEEISFLITENIKET